MKVLRPVPPLIMNEGGYEFKAANNIFSLIIALYPKGFYGNSMKAPSKLGYPPVLGTISQDGLGAKSATRTPIAFAAITDEPPTGAKLD